MKKQILLLSTVAILWISSSFATGKQVPTQVVTKFNSEFTQAQNTNWEEGDRYFKASFSLNGQSLFAYYSLSGENLGIARFIPSGQLPLNLQKEIWNKFDSYWLTDLFEYASYSETSYYVTLENADEVLILKGDDSGWLVFRKTPKV